MPIPKVNLSLYDYASKTLIDQTTSNAEGLFSFNKVVPNGKYFIEGHSPNKGLYIAIKGISANDASWIQQYSAASKVEPTPKLSMWWWAGNVDLSTAPAMTKGFSANDANVVQMVAANTRKQYLKDNVEVLENWQYSNDTIELKADTLIHVRGIMRGDANRDYEGTESGSELQKGINRYLKSFNTLGSIESEDKQRIIDYPILSLSSGDIRAFQVFVKYNSNKVEILGASAPISKTNVVYNVMDNNLYFNWLSLDAVNVKVGDTLAMLKINLLGKPQPNIDKYFNINTLGYEVTLEDVSIDPNWKIALPKLKLFYYEYVERDSLGYRIDTVGYTPTGKGGDKETTLNPTGADVEYSQILSVIPNPMKTWADITYSVHGECVVTLKLYTMLGEEIKTIVNSERQTGLYRRNISSEGLAAGVYVLRLETASGEKIETDVVKVVVQK